MKKEITFKMVMLVKRIVENSSTFITKKRIKEKVKNKIPPKLVDLILYYFKRRGFILEGPKGILWVYNPSPKLRKAIEKGVEV